jgi:hypothetical protein
VSGHLAVLSVAKESVLPGSHQHQNKTMHSKKNKTALIRLSLPSHCTWFQYRDKLKCVKEEIFGRALFIYYKDF